MENIMVIVPHEDDEILMSAGIIGRAVEEQKKVTVVLATNGDYEGTDKETGSVRLPETIAGLESLGLAREHIIFMGYADTGMDNAESFLFNLYRETDENRLHPGHCSAGTYGCSQKQDYHTASYGKGAEYTRKNFKEDLREIILQEKPDTIFTTSQEDVHGDHSGLFLFVREILEEEKENGFVPTLYTGLVHSKAGDDNWPRRGREDEPYTCPPGLDEGSLKWNQRVSFPLPEDMLVKDENGQNKKARALAKHKTALKEDAVEFLYTFIRPEEIFWKI